MINTFIFTHWFPAPPTNCFMISPSKVKRHLDYQRGEYVEEGYGVARWDNQAWRVLVPPSGKAPSPDQFARLAALLPTC